MFKLQEKEISFQKEIWTYFAGAAQADVAVLVVNSTRGEFETGFDAGGQTREHAMLIRSLGTDN